MIRIFSIIRPLMSDTMINDTLEQRRIGVWVWVGKLLLSICTQANNNNLCFPSWPMLIKVGICSYSMFRLVHKTSKNRKTVSNCWNWKTFLSHSLLWSVAEGKTLKRIVAYLNLIAFCSFNEERTGIWYPKIFVMITNKTILVWLKRILITGETKIIWKLTNTWKVV